MIGYNPSHLNKNETLLGAFHRVEAYLKANPLYQVYQSSAQYQENTQLYTLNTIIVPEGSTVSAGDVVFFSNAYYAVITEVSELTFSVEYATMVPGTPGPQGPQGPQGVQGPKGDPVPTVIDDNVEWEYMSLNNNTQSGFIFKSDDDAVVEFSSKQLGEEIEVEEGGVMTPFAHYSDIITCNWGYMHNASSPEEYEGGYFEGEGKIQDIGYFNVGEYIKIYTILGNLKSYTDNDYNCALTRTSYTLYRDGVLVAGGNDAALTYNVKIAGNYSFKLSVWGTHDKPETLIKETDKSVCIVNCDYEIQKSSTTGHISPNGISYSFNNNNSMVFFGSECAVLKYGNYGLKVSSDGIYRFNGSDWVLTSL